MLRTQPARISKIDSDGHQPEGEKLDRALIAGLMLEVILEAPPLPEEPQSRQRLVKNRLKETLTSQLAGRVTLDRFRALAGQLDQWFDFYYPLVMAAVPAPEEPRPAGPDPFPSPRPALREELWDHWLAQHAELLPRRRQRKLSQQSLRQFLESTGGGWFRLRDFEEHFGMDRKTAWEYLRKLRQAGLLRHNQGRSSAVRYCLAPEFLAAPPR